ncbi:hypothetical protein ACF0H5_014385 [Mactra antiquata]
MMKLFLMFYIFVSCQSVDYTPCCLSNKFTAQMMRIEARLTTGATKPQIDDVYYTINYDANHGKEMSNGYILNPITGHREHYTEYKDYNLNKKYTVNSSGCAVEDLNELMIPSCIAANYTLHRHYRLGNGQHSVGVTSWEGVYLGTLWLNIHFIDDGHCTPMALNIYGPTPDNAKELLNTYIFSDVQLDQFSSKEPFTLPQSCNHDQDVG